MAQQTASNYSGTYAFTYATAGTDQFRITDLQTLALAVDAHTHESGKGLQIPTDGIADDAVTVDKIGAGAVNSTCLTASCVTSAKIADGAVTADKLGAGSVNSTALSAYSVTPGKVKNVIAIRQGASTTNWVDSSSTTSHDLASTKVIIQCGCVTVATPGGGVGNATVTFPTAFKTGTTPLCFVSLLSDLASAAADQVSWWPDGNTGITIYVERDASAAWTPSANVSWFAVGEAT